MKSKLEYGAKAGPESQPAPLIRRCKTMPSRLIPWRRKMRKYLCDLCALFMYIFACCYVQLGLVYICKVRFVFARFDMLQIMEDRACRVRFP